ncbi:MAG: DUF4249 domain-containing protein [Marinifilaceae bacterium]|jgi:hypothetical protein|nr:DUF4249 domain-containing protein [Marinifilaceae bacterium]
MLKQYIKLIGFLFLFSCVETEEPKIDNLVINSFFSPSTDFTVQSSNSVSMFDTVTYKQVKAIKPKLYEDDKLLGELSIKSAYSKPGFASEIPESYSLAGFTPKQGRKYKLELDYNGKKITAEDVIPEAVDFEISNMRYTQLTGEYNDDGLELSLDFEDKKDEDNFYIIAFNSVEYTDKDDKQGWAQALGWMQTDDPSIEYSYYQVGNLSTGQRYIFSDKYFDGEKYTMKIRYSNAVKAGENFGLTIYLMSISKNYYKFIVSYLRQKQNNEDYYAEPTQVFNNIENGFGVFAGFSMSKKHIDFRNIKI